MKGVWTQPKCCYTCDVVQSNMSRVSGASGDSRECLHLMRVYVCFSYHNWRINRLSTWIEKGYTFTSQIYAAYVTLLPSCQQTGDIWMRTLFTLKESSWPTRTICIDHAPLAVLSICQQEHDVKDQPRDANSQGLHAFLHCLRMFRVRHVKVSFPSNVMYETISILYLCGSQSMTDPEETGSGCREGFRKT